MTVRAMVLGLFGSVLAAALPVSASAGDFTGFYAGGGLTSAGVGGDYTAFTPRNGYAGFDVQDLDPRSLGGTLFVGRNWDMGNMILGIEASITGFTATGDSTTSIAEGTVPPFWREVQNQFALTPRVGMVAGNSLIYAKAGLAASKVSAAHEIGGTMAEGSGTRTGWIVGIGAEIPLADSFNARIELTHANYGTDRYDLGSTGRWAEQDVTTTAVSLGFTYYFN